MLLLFINLYRSMLLGEWLPYNSLTDFWTQTAHTINGLGAFVTSIFGDQQYGTIGDVLARYEGTVPNVIALVLACITSIGIVVMAVKGVKKAFGIFFMGIRR